MVRLFVAVEIENPQVLNEVLKVKAEVASCSRGRGIKVVEDENVHLTLRFLGEVPEQLVQDVGECLKPASSFTKFSMRIAGLGAFPSNARPRIIWVGVDEGAEELRTLRNALEPCLRRFGKPDRNRFVPHITIARVKGSYDRACLANVFSSYGDHVFGTSGVSSIKLKKSVLRPEGPIYTDLAVITLEG